MPGRCHIFPRLDRAYTVDEQARFRADPTALQALRDELFWHCETDMHPIIVGMPETQAMARAAHAEYLASQVGDEQLRAALTPDYPLGCKRMLLSDDFYPALTRDQVELVTDRISGLDATGVRTVDGQHRGADVIVCGTGFDLRGHAASVQ